VKIQVGVMGSAGGRIPKRVREKARALGAEIAKHDCVLVTGACPGLPYDAVCGCKEAGGMAVGISPALDLHEHRTRYRSPWREFDVLVYTGDGLMGREVTGIRSCDIVIVIGGRSGTLGEFAIAYDEAKLIGVVQGTGGVADHVGEITKIVNKKTGATLVFDTDPEKLMDRLLRAYKRRRGRPPARLKYQKG
jgi:uncharacterized protein (TIGR00725 family)